MNMPKPTLSAVQPAEKGLEEMSFSSQFRAGGSTTVEPVVEPETKPDIAPRRAPAPDRDVPLPFQPPDPDKPNRAPDGDPARRHTVCTLKATL